MARGSGASGRVSRLRWARLSAAAPRQQLPPPHRGAPPIEPAIRQHASLPITASLQRDGHRHPPALGTGAAIHAGATVQQGAALHILPAVRRVRRETHGVGSWRMRGGARRPQSMRSPSLRPAVNPLRARHLSFQVMDNLAHALVGAALGRAVAGSRIPRAAWLGAVAANAPDWAELFTGYPWPGAQYLARHRGITHSLLGLVLEIAALTALLALGLAWWQRRRDRPVTPWWWVLLYVAATVLSHPLMDWQGSYGWRPFLPWSDRWYSGDFVAIVDPLFWLVPLVALAWGAPRRAWPATATLAVAVPIGWLLLRSGEAAPWLKAVCAAWLAVGAIGWVRNWFGEAGARPVAAGAIAVLAVYAGAQGIASLPEKAAIHRQAVARYGPDARWAALTVIGHPFTWEAVYADRDSVAGDGWAAARHVDVPIVRRAVRESPDGRAIARFARFLAADVDSSGPAVRMYLRDARYQPVGRTGWATVSVTME